MMRETLREVLYDLIPPLLVALPRRLFVVMVICPIRCIIISVLLEAVAVDVSWLCVFRLEKRISLDLVLSELLEDLLVERVVPLFGLGT